MKRFNIYNGYFFGSQLFKDPELDSNFIPQNIDELIIPKEVYERGCWRDYWEDIAEFEIYIKNFHGRIEMATALENHIKFLEGRKI